MSSVLDVHKDTLANSLSFFAFFFVVNTSLAHTCIYSMPISLLQEKFKDVVNWLKENKGKGENASPESRGPEKKPMAEVKNSDVKPVSNTSLFTSNNQPGLFLTKQAARFSTSHQSGSFSSQPGVFSSSPFGLASNSQTGSFSSGQFGLAKSSPPSLFSSTQAGGISNSQPSFSFSNNQNPFSSGGIYFPLPKCILWDLSLL